LEGNTARSDRAFTDTQRRLIQLEEIKSLIATNLGTIKDDFEHGEAFKTFRAHRLKRLSTGVGVLSEW